MIESNGNLNLIHTHKHIPQAVNSMSNTCTSTSIARALFRTARERESGKQFKSIHPFVLHSSTWNSRRHKQKQITEFATSNTNVHTVTVAKGKQNTNKVGELIIPTHYGWTDCTRRRQNTLQTLTSFWDSGSFMLSNIRKIILNRSLHQCGS